MCFAISFFNPYEYVSGNQTVILTQQEVNQNANNTEDPDILDFYANSPFVYYRGEVNRFK